MSDELTSDAFCPCGEYLIAIGTPDSRERAITFFLEWHDGCQSRLMGGDVRFSVDYRQFVRTADAVRAITEVPA